MSKLKDIVRRTPLSSTELPNLQEFDRQLAIQAALGRLEKPCTVYNGPLSSKLFYDESEAIPNWHRACPMQKPAPVAQDGYTQHVTRQAKREQSDFIIYAIHDLNLPWNAVQRLFADWWGVHETVYSLQQQYCRLGRNIPFWNEDGYVFSMNNSLKGKKIDHSRDTSPRFSHKLGLAEQAPERAVRYIWVDMGVKRKAQVRGEHYKSFLRWLMRP